MLKNLADVWRTLGRQPAFTEVAKGGGVSKFAGGTYRRRFGSWHSTLRAFEAFVRTGGLGAVTLPGQPAARPRSPRKVGWRLRATVLIRTRQLLLCRMCGASPTKDPGETLHVDHIVPWSKGERDDAVVQSPDAVRHVQHQQGNIIYFPAGDA